VIAACDVACPVVPGKRYENWGLPDPYRRPPDEVRGIRDEIAWRVGALSEELG
jgi:arsenate reductase